MSGTGGVASWVVLTVVVGMTVVAVDSTAIAQPQVDAETCRGAATPSVIGGCSDLATVGTPGCCDVTGRAFWCQGNNLYCQDCGDAGFEGCGWNPLGFYACGEAPNTSDPTGVIPISCDACPVECDGEASCSPTCRGRCGRCADAGAICLDDGVCWESDCDGAECGADSRGLSCGQCAADESCINALKRCEPLPQACVPQPGPGCDGCACEACVCEAYPSCCTEQWDVFCAAACEQGCGFECSACPAAPSCEGLECGSYCGVDCGTCEGDQVCTDFQCCTPLCDGRTCGDDGCGGTCGACGTFDTCVDGACLACAPNCPAGVTCGDDGCGGTCGSCGETETCDKRQCVTNLCLGACGTQEVDCGPDCSCFCDVECFDFGDCCPGLCEACGEGVAECCAPSCDGTRCDDDGCGGTCTCGASLGCREDGACSACQPSCDGSTCGPDGCGGVCGTCENGQTCSGSGACETCTPNCGGLSCGDDGCGGVCGSCSVNATCLDGACARSPGGPCGNITFQGCCETTLVWCENDVLQLQPCDGPCGWNADGFDGMGWHECGFSGADPTGQVALGCCDPVCSGKRCGDDGCGGSCGACAVDMVCEAFDCVPRQVADPEPDTTTADTAVETEPDTTAETASTDTTEPVRDTIVAADTAAETAPRRDDDAGCGGCTGAPSPQPGLWLIVGIALGLLRRRRRVNPR